MAFPSSSSPLSLGHVPAHHAGVRPHAVALRFGDGELTYQQLAQRSAQCSARLWHDWGVRPGDRIAWLGLNHPDQLVLLFALARIGALLLPLNFRLAPGEWDSQLRDCAPSRVVHDEAWAAQAGDLGRRPMAATPSSAAQRS